MSENKDSQNRDETPFPNEQIPQRPKHIIKRGGAKANDPRRTKSAPIEDLGTDAENNNYIGSYNYYIYYRSIKPVDPRLPKPTYVPKPNLDFIKESMPKEEEDDASEKKQQVENITKDMDKLNLKFDSNPKIDNNFLNEFNESNYNNKNFPQNKKKINKNNPDSPSTFDYYFSNESNDQQKDNNFQWGENLAPANIPSPMQGLGQMPNPNFLNMRLGPMNQLYGMNPYSNMQIPNVNQNNLFLYNNMNQRPNQINNNMKKNNQKKGFNNLDNFEQLPLGGHIPPNPYQNPSLAANYYSQFNPMMNMGMGLNMNSYLPNDQRMHLMHPIQNESNMPLSINYQMPLPLNMNGVDMYQNFPGVGLGGPNFQNPNMVNSYQNKKKNLKKENSIKKDIDNKSIEDIIENAVSLSKDNSGSRQIQKKYEEGPEDVRNKIFEKFKPEILDLSKDIFGNYAIQKVLEFGDPEKNAFIMNTIKGHIAELSLDMYGCRVMQQLIQVIDEEYLPQITLELKDKIDQCIENQNGNHVIQKLIDRIDIKENDEIYEVVYNNLISLSKHTYGCRVIQTLLKKCNEQMVEKMLKKIYEKVSELCIDQYGNYIIQYILEKKIGKNLDPIYDSVRGKIFEFSKHKYASNVVERALTLGNNKQRKNIIDEIVALDDEKKDVLFTLTKDKFGNYVVQKLIEYSDEKTKKIIIDRILSNPGMKKKEGFSKHVVNFIEKLKTANGGNQQGINNGLNYDEI